MMPKSLEERFWSKVEKGGPNDCWPWQGTKNRLGYGTIDLRLTEGKLVMAHRVSWGLANSTNPPNEMFVCHSCDNPGCVNPAHLWLGTPRDNMRDMIAKGRQRLPGRPAGSRNRPKTHCRHGHEFSPENTHVVSTTGERVCLICRRARGEAYKKRVRATAELEGRG